MTTPTSPHSSVQTPAVAAGVPLVSIVVLSYARPKYLAEALESIEGQSYQNLEILVVDNPSEASPEIASIVSRHPRIRLIQNAENVGFAGGMNVGMKSVSGDYVYLTEDDIVLERDCIRQLTEHAQSDPTLGLACGLMFNKRAGTIRCAGAHVSLERICKIEVLGSGDLDHGQFPHPFDVTYIPGAMMFASREQWQRLGGFRDDFFMYFEDVELCVRARRLKVRITVVPSSKVFHFEPSDKPGSDLLEFHKIKNCLSLYVLHAPLQFLILLILRSTIRDLPEYAVTNRKRASLVLAALRATWKARANLLRQRRVWRMLEAG